MMENLHKIVFHFNTTRAAGDLDTFLARRTNDVADVIKFELLDPADTIETKSKTAFVNTVWEWYGKMTSDTTREDIRRDIGTQKAKDDMAVLLEAVLTDDPSTVPGSVLRVK